MILADLALGTTVFVDANVFIYHFTAQPRVGPPCTALIHRVEQKDIIGFTAAHILTEAAHRLMLIEASAKFGWPLAGALKRLQRRHADVQVLSQFRQAVEEIVRIGFQLLPAGAPHVLAAAAISQQTGLLSNDALSVALMQAHGIANLGSHDTDFDRVPGLTRYGPV